MNVTEAGYEQFIGSSFVDERLAGDDAVSVLVVRGGAHEFTSPGSLPVVVCWVGAEFGAPGPSAADVVVAEGDLAELLDAVERSPLAATSLAVLLRSTECSSVGAGLSLESSVYSMLQAGPEFAAWDADHRARPRTCEESERVVEMVRRDDKLVISLDRPRRHNAINRQLRDELYAALVLADSDDTISSVVLRGNGPSFCSGGDLEEFGTRPDPATAHRVRLARSPARLLDRLRLRTHVELHGWSLGGGIEFAAFAGRVTATADTLIGLPEIRYGLIPGAGGTVSVTRRIGRQRTAALGLTGRVIDADRAAQWGLIDEIVPGVHPDPAPA